MFWGCITYWGWRGGTRVTYDMQPSQSGDATPPPPQYVMHPPPVTAHVSLKGKSYAKYGTCVWGCKQNAPTKLGGGGTQMEKIPIGSTSIYDLTAHWVS